MKNRSAGLESLGTWMFVLKWTEVSAAVNFFHATTRNVLVGESRTILPSLKDASRTIRCEHHFWYLCLTDRCPKPLESFECSFEPEALGCYFWLDRGVSDLS